VVGDAPNGDAQRPRRRGPDSDSPSLSVRDLRVGTSDDAVVVVDEVTFAVEAGEVLALVGESGSGKTTVALALLGHTRRGLRIWSGSVSLRGTQVVGATPTQLRAMRGAEIAYVPQDPASALNPVMRVGAQVAEALLVHGYAGADRDDRVGEVLREVGIAPDPEMLRRYPHQLSGGQQQRVALAMAFACRPSVIVLDEPTTGLDVSTQRLVLETVRTLCAAYGVAAVYVSHDLAVVNELATNVAVLYAGRIVEYGPTTAVFNAAVHPYTRGLIASVPSARRSEVVPGIAGQPPRPGRRPAGCAFAPRCELRAELCATTVPGPTLVDGRTVRCLRAQESLARGHVRRAEIAPPRELGASRLVVRNLCASYGRTQVLTDVSFEVHREQCVAIVGESGAGKTTLAQCIVGLQRNWTGEVSLDGESLATEAQHRQRDVLRRVQYVFQNPYLSLNPRKTIAQIVGEPLRHFFSLRGAQADERVASALDDVSLGGEYLERYPDQLSGGERQRVAIARALIVEPEVLVCDEITSALDVSVQAVIVELLRRLQLEHHLSMIFITHNLALVRSVAQACVVLSEGRVVESGNVDDVLDRPTHPYTAQLISDIPMLEADRGGLAVGGEYRT
jgi:peptide/nickel transport system ATP-binding protein